MSKIVDVSQSAVSLDKSVQLQLAGGASHLVGEWLLALWVAVQLNDYKGGKSVPNTVLADVGLRVSQAFGSAHEAGHAPVDYHVVITDPSINQVRNLFVAGEYLAGLVLSDSFDAVIVDAINRPSTTVQHARSTKTFDELKAEPEKWLARYADVAEHARQLRKSDKPKAPKAEPAPKADAANSNDAAEPDKPELPVQNPLVDAINSRLNKALEKHSPKAVHDAVMKALDALDKPEPAPKADKPKARGNRRGSAASA